MNEHIDLSLIDWSRAQFALTAIYHWMFVPLTLGLGIVQAIMETMYVRTGDEFWKRTAKFWMKLFGINFAIGVATGLILEFEFGTNWSNYSWFVGDIFGAPLAIEGILAFFMEATFVAVMFFGWDKVSKRAHLASTWLTITGATISAWWILVANAWMQSPVGMAFNPDTVRNEMVDFWAVALSPMAVNKFFHTVISSWMVGAAFVVGISCWYLIKGRERKFALASIRIGALFGLVATVLTAWTGDGSAYQVAQRQPMKLAAMEGLYEGGNGVGLKLVGDIEIPNLLSLLAEREMNAYVPGINNLLEGGYTLKNGEVALSAFDKMERGRLAIDALAGYREAKKNNDSEAMALHKQNIDQHFAYFGYGYIQAPDDLVPNVPLTFWAFRVMVAAGCYLLLFFLVIYVSGLRSTLQHTRWMQWVGLWTIPVAYVASQMGWVVAEVGRQPWAIQDLLPVGASISRLSTGSVQTTFFLFLILFTVLLIAEVRIMLKAIKHGPELQQESSHH